MLLSIRSRRWFLAAVLPLLFCSGCTNKQTRDALEQAKALQDQKEYEEANEVLVQALRAREAQIHPNGTSDPADTNAPLHKVESDSEILKLERAQIPIYLAMQRADLASAVFSDIENGNPGDSVLLDLAKDPEPAKRIGAIRVLGLVGDPASIDALTVATHDADKDVRRAAVASLGEIASSRAVPPLIASLGDSYWFVRSDAASALGLLRDGRAIGPLFRCLTDRDESVRSSAESSLTLLAKNPGVTRDEFIAQLTDPNPEIAVVAATCLALVGDPQAIPVLLRLGQNSDLAVRIRAVKALEQSGDSAALPLLRQNMLNSDANLRGWSIVGLAKQMDKDSLPALRNIANDATQPPRVRATAAAAVDHISGADQRPPAP